MLPRPGTVYTVREINELELKDTPFLRVPVPERFGGSSATPIQFDVSLDTLIPVIGDLEFEYQRTTHEYIPLFIYRGSPDKLAMVLDFALDRDPHADAIGCWVTVKDFRQEQDYRWDESGTKFVSDYAEYPAPDFLIAARE